MRRLPAGVRLDPAELVLPMFVKEGISEPAPISSMPGVVQHTRESLRKAASEAVEAGVGGLILFGIPAHKDARGSSADDPDGIVQLAIGDLVSEVGDAFEKAFQRQFGYDRLGTLSGKPPELFGL